MARSKRAQESLTCQTARLNLHVLTAVDAPRVVDYLKRNESFHRPWFPQRDESALTLASQRRILQQEHDDFESGRAIPFWLTLRSDPQRIVGRFILNTIVRGAFQSATLSYHLDEQITGQGLAQEAGSKVLDLAFNTFGLHRVEANIRPENVASIALAGRLGLVLEGFSPRYLQIAGQWADHFHFVRLSDSPVDTNDACSIGSAEPLIIRTIGRSDFDALSPRLLQDSGLLSTIQLRFANHLRSTTQLQSTNQPQPDCVNRNPMDADSFITADRRRLFAELMLNQQRGQLALAGIYFAKQADQPVGLIGLRHQLALPLASSELCFGLDGERIDPNQSIQVLKQFVVRYFATHSRHRITTQCTAQDDFRIRILAQLGFQQTGIEPQAYWSDDLWHDLLRFQIINPKAD